MNFHIVRTIRSFPSSFFLSLLSSFFSLSLFFSSSSIFIFHEKDARRTKAENIIVNLPLIPHFDHDTVTRRKIYETCSQRAAYWWKISLRFFFATHFLFFFSSLSLSFFSPSRLGQDKLSLEEYISEIFLKGKFIDLNVPCSSKLKIVAIDGMKKYSGGCL